MKNDDAEQSKNWQPEDGETGPGADAGADASLRAQHLDLDVLSAYLDHQLESADRTAVRAHLVTCPECGRELAELRATVSLLHELPQYAPRRHFQLGPEHARQSAGAAGWFARLLPAFPALRVATVAVAVLLMAVIAGDLIVNRGQVPDSAQFTGGSDVEESFEAPQLMPAMPAAESDRQRTAAFQATVVFDEAEEAEMADEAGTDVALPASVDDDGVAEEVPSAVAPEAAVERAPPPAAEPSPAVSGWRLAQVGLGLLLLWLIVSLVGVARLRRNRG